MHKILVIRIYFPLDALHVSDYIGPSSGATFISRTSHLVHAGICRYHTSGCCVVISTQQPDVSTYTGIYQMRCTAYKVAPDDGLIQSETCRAYNEKIKSNHNNFVYLVGLCTYCNMMHGTYSVKSCICIR